MQETLGTTMDDDAWAEWLAAFEDPQITPEAKKEEESIEWEMRMRAQLRGNQDEDFVGRGRGSQSG